MNGGLRRFLDGAMELIYPSHANCMGCASPLGSDVDWLCHDCAKKLVPVGEMDGFRCDLCGRVMKSGFCIACIDWPEDGVSKARCAYAYQPPVDRMVHRMKYEGVSKMVEWMSAEMVTMARSEGMLNADLVVPVPMHPRRERARGYNQAVLLAGSLCLLTDMPLANALIRTRNTKQQARLNAEARRQNLEGAFRAAVDVRGKRVLLVDDVLTTGTTANQCASALRRAGASDVWLIAFAGVME